MSHAMHVHQELQTGAWADPNPSHCPCRASGWFLSDYDAWYACPLHNVGQPHPELDDEDTFDYEAAQLRIYREAFAGFRQQARQAGFRGNFKLACERELQGNEQTPANWASAAEHVAVDAQAASHSQGWQDAPLVKQVALLMSQGDDSDFDWDAWADDMKEGSFG